MYMCRLAGTVCVCVCVCVREGENEVEGGNKGIWLQNWVRV